MAIFPELLRPAFSALGILLALVGPCTLHGAEIKFIPQVSITDRYNDNIFHDSRSQDTVHDIIAVIAPSLRLTARTERLDSFLQSVLQRNEYYEQHDLEATDQYHSGRIRYLLAQRVAISVDAKYVRDSQIDRDVETTGLLLGASTRERTHYGGMVDTALMEKTSMNVSYNYDKDTFDDPEYSDSTIQGISLVLNHDLDALLSETSVRLTPSYSLYDYTYFESTSYSLTVGLTRRLTELIEFSADLGSHVSRDRNILFGLFEEREKNRGMVGQVAFSYRGETTTSSISYYQDYRSISGEVGLARYSSARFDINRRFTYECTGGLTAEYTVNKQEERSLVSSGIDETSIWIRPVIAYNHSEDLRVEAYYRLFRIRDNDEHSWSTQNVISLNVTWRYPMPR